MYKGYTVFSKSFQTVLKQKKSSLAHTFPHEPHPVKPLGRPGRPDPDTRKEEGKVEEGAGESDGSSESRI